jgi:hypothetical protein
MLGHDAAKLAGIKDQGPRAAARQRARINRSKFLCAFDAEETGKASAAIER